MVLGFIVLVSSFSKTLGRNWEEQGAFCKTYDFYEVETSIQLGCIYFQIVKLTKNADRTYNFGSFKVLS